MTELSSGLAGQQNPFLRYRRRLDSYRHFVRRTSRLSDEQFVAIVAEFDAEVARVWGRGFLVSPLVDGATLAQAAGIEAQLSIKVEVDGVGGSHKARHLFGTAIWQRCAQALTPAQPRGRLAIASCGNAAMGAAVVARAMDQPLDVFVPTWADEVVVDQLVELGATVNRCERRDGEAGDPAYLRFREAVVAGAEAFSVQGTDTGSALDGARTIGWEISEQTAQIETVDALYVQVGGGALATCVSNGLRGARLHPVQAEGCAPLRRAWDQWAPDFDYDVLAAENQTLMTPWENPQSFATGILDDVTYDFVPLLARTHLSGGYPIVAPESEIKRAYALAHEHTTINVCSTGSSGFAGVLTDPPSTDEHVAVLFTGIDRT